MPSSLDILKLLGAVAVAVALVVIVRLRRRSHERFIQELAGEEVCEHLRPALEILRQRGHRVVRAGQRRSEMPLEIHVDPPFNPQALYDELKLQEPVFVSERNVLYCKEDWCELHPVKG